LPPLLTLMDGSRAITAFLPRERMRQAHWLRAGWADRTAATSAHLSEELVRDATEALVTALEAEGWMSHDRARARVNVDAPPRLPARLRA
jgi:hypothetical protein